MVGKIFAYLPVREGTGFPFLINSDFILPSSREEVLDVPWNRRWLMECVADLTARKLLPLLKEQKFLRISFLEKLASKLNDLAGNENDLFYPVFSRLRDTFVNEDMLPAHDKTFVSAQDAKLADSEGLIGLLDSNQLSLLFKKSGVTKWLLSDITARRTQNLWKYLRNELGIDEVDPEMFARRIDKPFLEQQSDGWFIDFYRFLSVGERPPRSLWTVSSNILHRSGILLSKPILRLQDNSLVNPNESNVYLSKGTDSETTSRLIKSEISQNEDAHKFLKELDVAEWNLVAEVIEHIVPKYRNNASAVPRTEYYRDFSKIVSAYTTDSQKKRDRLLKGLMTTPFILVGNPSVNGQIYLRPDQLYFGTDGLWQCKSNGNYLPVSVHKEVSQFLKELDIPQWDAVEEVIKTILPKYKQNPPRVFIETHMNDFKKITHAYKTSDKFRKDRLKEALQASHFILAEHPEADFPIYLKPSYLYFPSDALRMYFGNYSLACWVKAWNDENEDLTKLWNYFVPGPSSDPPIAGAFVNLDRYTNTDREFFEDLGVASTARVERKEKGGDGHIHIKKQRGKNMRGIKGFDPDVRVDGLEFIIEYVRCTRVSAFIWNEIVLPNADCIHGSIETSRRQDFSNSSSEEVISPYFGRLLIDNAWLPDSDGNMHKPSDITLDDLPDAFQKNEQLARQLDMPISKSRIIDIVAPEIGVSSDILNGILNAAPETIKQIESLLQSGPGFGNLPSSPTSDFDPTLSSQPTAFPVSSVSNPARRKRLVLEELEDAPDQEYVEKLRSVRTTRGVIDPKTWLSAEYINDDGLVVCQICHEEMPFKYSGENYYFDAVEMLKGYFTKEYEAQFLALCPECSPKYRTFVKQVPEVMDALKQQLMDSDDSSDFQVPLRLGNWDTSLRFVERHWLDIKAILSFYEQQSEETVEMEVPNKKPLEPEKVPDSQPIEEKENWDADRMLDQFFAQPVCFATYAGLKDLSQVKIKEHDLTGVNAEGAKTTLTKLEILFAFPKEKMSAVKPHVQIRRELKDEGLQPVDAYRNRFQVADKLLRQVKENESQVKVVTRAGYVLNGKVQHFDKYVLYMRVGEKVVVVYRHGLFGFKVEKQ